jgi:hypothetical protein
MTRSGDIEWVSDHQRQGQCLRVLQRSTAVCDEAKNSKSWLPARVVTMPVTDHHLTIATNNLTIIG